MSMSTNPGLSITPTSESTKSPMVISRKSPGLFLRPGKSGRARLTPVPTGESPQRSAPHESAASPPPCTRTNAGNVIAGRGLLKRRCPGLHRKARGATTRRIRRGSQLRAHGSRARVHERSAPSRTRTDTVRILSPLPLPIGLWGPSSHSTLPRCCRPSNPDSGPETAPNSAP
jgi:hypothetical protein